MGCVRVSATLVCMQKRWYGVGVNKEQERKGGEKKRERDRERERERQRETDRERQRETDRERQTERDTQRETHRQTDRHRERMKSHEDRTTTVRSREFLGLAPMITKVFPRY